MLETRLKIHKYVPELETKYGVKCFLYNTLSNCKNVMHFERSNIKIFVIEEKIFHYSLLNSRSNTKFKFNIQVVNRTDPPVKTF